MTFFEIDPASSRCQGSTPFTYLQNSRGDINDKHRGRPAADDRSPSAIPRT